MNVIWGSLIATHAIIAVFVVAWGMLERWLPPMEKASGRLCFGILVGLTAIAAMSMSAEVMPGFMFDLRHPLIAASGLFAGPLAAVVTGIMSASYRAYLGGGGALAGVIGIGVSASIGLAGHYLFGSRRKSLPRVLGFACLVGPGVLTSLLVLDASLRSTLLQQVGLPMVVMTFLGTLVTVLLIETEVQKRRAFQSNRLYRAMVKAMPDCLNVKDLEGRFLIANKATADVLNAPETGDIIGKTYFDFYETERATELRAMEQAVIKSGEARQTEQLFRFVNGSEAWFSTLKVPLRDDKGQMIGIITHNRDITDLHNLAVQKEQFISTVSHELRSPVTSIRGALGLICSLPLSDMNPKVSKLITTADRNARRLAELIDDILDFEKVVSGKMDFEPEEIDVAETLSDAVDAIAHYLPEKGVSVQLDNQAPDARISVNPQRLNQILSNLLSNAVKFSPEGGRVTVSTSRASGFVQIAVCDQGPGVPPEFEAQLFERYSQDKIRASKANRSNIASTGLGLSIAKEMVNKMGGDIRYDRTSGSTAFVVSLPELTMAQSA